MLTLPVRSYALYEGPLVRSLLRLKYHPNLALASQMGAWLADVYRRTPWQATLIVPVPLGRERLKQRGYNQSALIASDLAERLSLPVSFDGLRRTRETRSQVGLDPETRLVNVSEAFHASPAVVQGHAVLLIDDLFTTGATLSACARALHDAGVAQVMGLTVGRA